MDIVRREVMSKEKAQKEIRELIERYSPIAQLAAISRDIERYGEVGEEERAALKEVWNSCKDLAEGIEEILKRA